MKRNYVVDEIAYEVARDRSRAYVSVASMRKEGMRPGAHALVESREGRSAILRLFPRFEGDEGVVYVPEESLAGLGAKTGDVVALTPVKETRFRDSGSASSVEVVFKEERRDLETRSLVKSALLDMKYVKRGAVVYDGLVDLIACAGDGHAAAAVAEEEEYYVVGDDTEIRIKVLEEEREQAELIGLARQEKELETFIDLCLSRARFTARGSAVDTLTYGQGALQVGACIHGMGGCGKRSLCRQAARRRRGVECIVIRDGDDLEARVAKAYEYGKLNEPCIIHLERIDRMAGAGAADCSEERDAEDKLHERRARLLQTLEGIFEEVGREQRRIAFVATAVNYFALPKEYRAYGMFDKEILLPVPDHQSRRLKIESLLRARPEKCVCMCIEDPSRRAGAVEEIARRAAGFTYADISLLFRDAHVYFPASAHPGAESCEESSRAALASLSISPRGAPPGGACRGGACIADVLGYLSRITPSAVDHRPSEIPSTSFSMVHGQEHAKLRLMESVVWPVKHREVYDAVRMCPPKGILLYGPPGCSKTLLAKALATESEAVFLSIRGPEIMGKYVGESEGRIRRIFQKARSLAPAIVFIDEIDSIAPHRGEGGGQVDKRVVSTLLTEMDGITPSNGVVVLAATNKPWTIDSALMRPGRFDYHVFIDLPDAPARESMLKGEFGRMGLLARGEEAGDFYASAVQRTDGYTGAEVMAFCREAGMEYIRSVVRKEASFDLKRAALGLLEAMRPRIPEEELSLFREFHKQA